MITYNPNYIIGNILQKNSIKLVVNDVFTKLLQKFRVTPLSNYNRHKKDTFQKISYKIIFGGDEKDFLVYS